MAEETPALRASRVGGLYSRGEPVFRISDDSSFATTQRQVHFLAWLGRAHPNLNLNYSPTLGAERRAPSAERRASVTPRRVSLYFSPPLPCPLVFSVSLIFSALLSGTSEECISVVLMRESRFRVMKTRDTTCTRVALIFASRYNGSLEKFITGGKYAILE